MNFYQLHGVHIRVAGPRDLTATISRRLAAFQSRDEGRAHLEFVLTRADPQIEVSYFGPGRRVYELEGGDVLYHAQTETLTARYRECVSMTCDLASGQTTYLLGPEAEALEAATHILFTLALIEQLRRRGLYNVHAAGVCRGNAAILLAGASGAGKSTLSLALTQAGWAYMGDDMLFLQCGSDDVFGFPEGINCSPEIGVNFPKVHVRPEHAFGTEEVRRATPRALVFPRVAHTEQSRLKPLDSTEAFLELASNAVMSDRSACESHLQLLAKLSRTIPAFRLETGRDLAQAGRTIAALTEC